jgi:ATP-dependent exoDNAse (exonuclease V) beta subunit
VRALSYSGLESYAQCPYRFYLERVLRLPQIAPPAAAPEEEPGELPPLLRGTLAHALLERLDFAAPVEPAVAAVAAELRVATLTDAGAEDLRALVAAFVASPLRARLANAAAVRREAPFAFPLAGVLVNGVVDVIAREDDRALVVDYKTDRLEPGEDVEERTARDYGVQRLVYALAALRDGAPAVEVAHCFLDRAAEPATAVCTQADVPRLEQELTALAQGALAGEFPVTAEPHRRLCGTCPGRPALCSHPEELTLREDPRARARAS